MMKKASDKWYFTKETNAKGLCYIYAYQTQWDPVTKKSKRSARKYVGLDKTLVDEAAVYRRDFPDAPVPKPAAAEMCKFFSDRT